MKKVYLIILIMILSITMISCKNESEDIKVQNKKENFKIGVLLEKENDDNEKITEALKKGKDDFNVTYETVVCSEDQEYERYIESFVEGDYSLIIGTSQASRWSIEKMAGKYPDSKFLIVDSVIDGDNVQSIIFKENEGAFLLGIIAGMTSSTNEIAFIGGKDIGLINQLEIGFASGVYYANKEAGSKLIKKDNVEYLNSFIDVNKSYRITQNFINNNCDIVYTAAGGASLGIYTCLNELKENGGHAFILGDHLGADDFYTEFKGLNFAILENKIDDVIYSALEELSKNEFYTGKVYEIGIIEDGIDVKIIQDSIAKDEVIDTINESKMKIKNGDIIVPSNYEELQNVLEN